MALPLGALLQYVRVAMQPPPQVLAEPQDSPEQLSGRLSDGLERYDTGADRYTARRMRQFLIYVVLPVFLFCFGGAYLVFGRDQRSSSPPKRPTMTLTVVAVSTVVRPTVSGDTVLGGVVSYSGQMQSTQSRGTPVPSPVPTVRCYARVDSRSVYSDSVVYQNGLFLAEAFTRARGGMIWNARFGWFRIEDFACAPGIENIEVEFIEPRSPTPRPVYPTRTRTPTPLPPTYTPTATLSQGILIFDTWDCSNVRWLVWGVSRVYVSVGDQRWGVAGDNRGQPVERDLCEYRGQRIRIDAVLPSGQQIYRESVIR